MNRGNDIASVAETQPNVLKSSRTLRVAAVQTRMRELGHPAPPHQSTEARRARAGRASAAGVSLWRAVIPDL